MTAAALVIVAGLAWFGPYASTTRLIILAVAVAKGIETLSDVHYGLFQLNDRLDQDGALDDAPRSSCGGGDGRRIVPDA